MTPPRNITIDVAKGIGIILIVFGHNRLVMETPAELFRLIFSFHVPLFFFLAGVFLRPGDRFPAFIAAKADTLVKPCFVVLLALCVLKLITDAWMHALDVRDVQFVVGLLYATGATIATDAAIGWDALWFLPNLFVASIACLVILRRVDGQGSSHGVLALIALALLAVGIFAASWLGAQTAHFSPPIHWGNLPGLPWSLDLVPLTIAFMLTGYLLRQRVQSLSFQWLPFLVASGVFFALHFRYDETMDLNSRVYGQPVISTLQAVTGIYLTLGISAWIQRLPLTSRVLAYIGSGSLFILIFHGYLQGRAYIALTRLGADPVMNGLVSLAAGVGLPLLLLEVVKRQKYLAKIILPRKSLSLRAEAPAV